MYKFSTKSQQLLNTVHKDLGRIAQEVIKISKVDFGITDGRRDLETQQKYFADGKSQCDGVKKKSKHQDGLAIDIMCYIDGKGTWDKKYYYYVAGLFEVKAKELHININWGGWFSFEDCVHIEIA